MANDQRVMMAHGGGGELMQDLIHQHILPPLNNDTLSALTDGAELGQLDGQVVFTTDSFVVSPLRFPGGDIGRLAVCGTVNDLAMMAARPIALSLGMIIEEGLPLAMLDEVLDSIASAAAQAEVQIVTGDTKVIERRVGIADQTAAQTESESLPGSEENGLIINTAGIGLREVEIAPTTENIEPGDVIVINGHIAEHGLAVMSVRQGLEFTSTLRSDAAPLNSLIAATLAAGLCPKFLRDPTRGGLAGTLVDIAEATGQTIEVDEEAIPVSATARHAAELLGLDPLTVANEGKCVLVVAAEEVSPLLDCLRAHPLGRNSVAIGRVTEPATASVELITKAGGRRLLRRPYGEELPRIC